MFIRAGNWIHSIVTGKAITTTVYIKRNIAEIISFCLMYSSISKNGVKYV